MTNLFKENRLLFISKDTIQSQFQKTGVSLGSGALSGPSAQIPSQSQTAPSPSGSSYAPSSLSLSQIAAQSQNDGGTAYTESIDPLTGKLIKTLDVNNTTTNTQTPEEQLANAKYINPSQNPQSYPNLHLIDTSTLTPHSGAGYGGVAETPAEFEQRKAAVEAQNTEKLKQAQMQQNAQQNSSNSAPPTVQPSTPNTPGMNKNPDIQAIAAQRAADRLKKGYPTLTPTSSNPQTQGEGTAYSLPSGVEGPTETPPQTNQPPQADGSVPNQTPPSSNTTPGDTGSSTPTPTPSTTPDTTPGGTPSPTPTPSTPNSQPTTTPQPLDGVAQVIGPDLAAALQGTIDNGNAQILKLQILQLQGTIDQQTALNTAQTIKDSVIQQALQQKQDTLDFNAKQDSLNRQAVENSKIDAQDIIDRNKAQSDLNSHIAYHNQEIQNTETEMQNRNYAAKMGINFDSGGLKWMQTQQQKGVDALDFISQQMAINSSGFAKDSLKVVRDYTQNTLQASQEALGAYNTAWKTYNDSMNSANSNYAATATSLREYTGQMNEKYANDINTIDQNLGNTYKDLASKMIDQSTALYRIQFDRQQAAMAQVKDIWTATGGQMTPALQSSIDAAKAAGVGDDRLAGFGTGQLTMTGIQNSYQAQAYHYMDPNTWTDQPSKDVMNLLGGVTFSNTNEKLGAVADVGGRLAAGDISGARNKVITYALRTLPPDTQKSVQSGLNIERQIDTLQSFIAQNQDALKNSGVYERKGQELLIYANKSQDPMLRQFYSMITKINATEMHDLYGARLTDVEIGFGKDFLAQTNEPLGNVIGKLSALKNDISGQMDQVFSQALSTGNPYLSNDVTGDTTGGTTSNPSPVAPTTSTGDWNTKWNTYNGTQASTGAGGTDHSLLPSTGPLKLSSLGTITQPFGGTYDMQHGLTKGPHYATDIVIPGGHVPALTSGKVIVINGGDLGLHLQIKESNGDVVTLGHFASLNVKTGDTVTRGQFLGLQGHSGNTNRGEGHSGDHVHIAVQSGGRMVDPENYFSSYQIASQ